MDWTTVLSALFGLFSPAMVFGVAGGRSGFLAGLIAGAVITTSAGVLPGWILPLVIIAAGASLFIGHGEEVEEE